MSGKSEGTLTVTDRALNMPVMPFGQYVAAELHLVPYNAVGADITYAGPTKLHIDLRRNVVDETAECRVD